MSEQDLEQTVLAKIRRGEVHMRSRLFFVLQTIVIAAVALFALCTSIFALSFVLFSVRESGELLLLGWGLQGVLVFLSLFPWIPLLVAVCLLFLLDWLLRYFKWGYRTPLLYLFFGALAAIFLVGSLINFTPLQSMLLNQADHGRLPLFGALYETIRLPHEAEGEFRGIIIAVQNGELVITHNDHDADMDDGIHMVVPPTGFDLASLHIGDRVYVAGGMMNGVIQAFGLQKLP